MFKEDGIVKKLVFSYAEFALDKKKMFLTPLNNKDLYGTDGYINLGNEKSFVENAKNLVRRINADNIAVCFVPLFENPFVIYVKDGEMGYANMGYFNFAKDVFARIGWCKDYARIGLIEEVLEKKWEIIAH